MPFPRAIEQSCGALYSIFEVLSLSSLHSLFLSSIVESISVLFLLGADDRKHILAGGLELILSTPTSRACKSSNFCRDCLETINFVVMHLRIC